MKTLLIASTLFIGLTGGTAMADSEFSLGGSVGYANIEDDDFDLSFDESDTGYKLFANYTFDSGIGIEGGYVDFGEPDIDILGSNFGIDASGWNVYAVGNLPLSRSFDLFAKAGVISWDADAIIDGVNVANDDGTDLALSLGAGLNLSDSLGIRSEFDWYDVSDADAVWMVSVGLEFRFQ